MAEFVTVANIDELKPGECKVVTANGRSLALYNVDGKFYITDNTCLHRGGPLGDGVLDGQIVTCPWHDWQFNVVNGKNLQDEQIHLKTFEVAVNGEQVRVKI